MNLSSHNQIYLFDNSIIKKLPRQYLPVLTISENRKGVLGIDSVKGCSAGMSAYPKGGCYGECYACKISKRTGIDFTKSVSRRYYGQWHKSTLCLTLNKFNHNWYRIGVMGDPCHDWENTISVCKIFNYSGKTPVIITKHWKPLTDDHLIKLKKFGAVINTSISGLDTDDEFCFRLSQIERINGFGIKSVSRIISCLYGNTEYGRSCSEKQDYLFSLKDIIDNPLRISRNNPHVLNGDIITTKRSDSIGGGKLVSVNNKKVFLGHCINCIDQCGVDKTNNREVKMLAIQEELFKDKVEFEYVKSVIGSGYEKDVADLALEDGIAHRAARKNMQIHSAIILKVNDKFSGFMTFQVNDICKEFCLLQSVIKPEHFTPDLYREMVVNVVNQNHNKYPAIITTDPKSKFETPALFKSIGFQTYLEMSGFHYMVKGNLEDVRMKLLAHITMTNCWNPNSANWLKVKKVWNENIIESGERQGIKNALYASRDGCWQGTNGFANVVTGHSHNGNASVLDPVACEVILRFFMPRDGKRVYNPFGGGVQFGYVSGFYGYDYIASEIRQNQCDANNKICEEFGSARWVKSDSSKYEPDGNFDLVFSCPPYYKVEKYIDYDGLSPEGEINSLDTYEKFRDALFSGYGIAIDHLNDNCFFVIMTGDSRDSKGAFYCSESETELFLKGEGLSIYNRIVYVESEFTRLAHAKKTLNTRKFPKREQKIIAAYKGDISKIKELYAPLGRL